MRQVKSRFVSIHWINVRSFVFIGLKQEGELLGGGVKHCYGITGSFVSGENGVVYRRDDSE